MTVAPQGTRQVAPIVQAPANRVQPSATLGQNTNPFVRRSAPPLAAAQPQGTYQPNANTRSFRIGAGDVRHANQNNYARRDNGLSDFQKFGLIALGAVAIGAILSNGDHVISNSGDRVVVRDPYGRYNVYHDDDALLYRSGTDYTTQEFPDGSILSRYTQPDGTVIVTIRDADGRVLSRHIEYPGGRRVILFDDTHVSPPPIIAELPPQSPIDLLYTAATDPNLLRAAFETRPIQPVGRTFSLQQIRDIAQVRYLSPEVELTTPNFNSGSSAIDPTQAESLATLGRVMADMIAANPREVFLIEGHSDAVGDPAMNLALSDARAQGLALALTEYYGVPPENMITQGYGESFLKNQTQGPDEANRRVVVRRITGLLN
ncbi:MAG: OmpA family protein [Paracoccaceae bacterium]|nr:OmpA family protein [Paracoccaceae bacterium]